MIWNNDGTVEDHVTVAGDSVDMYEITTDKKGNDYAVIGYTFTEKDANLVAAAPELLFALKKLVEQVIPPHSARSIALAAIAKAEG